MHIISKENPKIKLCNKLLSSKKSRQEMGLFFIEGARLCGDALNEWRNDKLELAAVFASENALLKYKDYIDSKYFEDDRSGIFYTVDDNICKKISDTKANQE